MAWDEGYVYEHRSVMEHAVFQDDWLYRLFRWCVMKANFAPGRHRGVDVPVGSFITGKNRAAEQLGVTPSKWWRGIHRLAESPYEVIAINANRDWTMISVINYSTYQGAKSQSEPPANRQRTASEPPAKPIEESNKSIRQESKKDSQSVATAAEPGTAEATSDFALATPTYPEAFETFWTAYPARKGRKRGKDVAFATWRREVKASERDSVLAAARNYAKSDDARRGFAKDAERFLKNRWWTDWLDDTVAEAAAHSDPRGNLAVVAQYEARRGFSNDETSN